MTVVDASAIAAMLFAERDGDTIAAHLEGETLIAPHLIDYELAHVCEKKVRRHAELREALLISFAMLDRFSISRVAVPTSDVVVLSLATGLSTYDASYLWLAMQHDAELVTLDDQLARVNERLRGEQ